MKTREIALKNADTMKFAEHFKTKSSVKNLLKKVPHAKEIGILFDDEKYAKEILGYSNLSEQFDTVVADALTTYSAQVAEWRVTGDNRPLSARVDLLKDILAERIKKSPGPELAATMGDFMKSSTGKEISEILENADIKEDNDVFNLLTWVAMRATLISATLPIEEVKGDIVVENASHTISGSGVSENPLIEDKETKKNMEKAMELLQSLSPNSPEEEFRRIITILKPHTNIVIDALNKIEAKETEDFKVLKSSIVNRGLPESSINENGDKIISFLSSLDNGFALNNQAESIIVTNLFIIIYDTLNHLNDDEKLLYAMKLVIALMGCGNDESALVAEIINQAGRVDDIIKEMSGNKEVPTSSAQEGQKKIPEYVPEFTEDEINFAEMGRQLSQATTPAAAQAPKEPNFKPTTMVDFYKKYSPMNRSVMAAWE